MFKNQKENLNLTNKLSNPKKNEDIFGDLKFSSSSNKYFLMEDLDKLRLITQEN